VNHLGYCLLGIFALAVPIARGGRSQPGRGAERRDSADVQPRHDGGGAVLVCGHAAARTGGHRGIDDFGGLRKPAPVLAGLMGIALFSSLGLPGAEWICGRVPHLPRRLFRWPGLRRRFRFSGLLVTAAVILDRDSESLHGPVPEHCASFPDLTRASGWRWRR
jgi:NADH-quinone oxidoreductase subunit M